MGTKLQRPPPGARPSLYSLAIELTAHCNQKCTYCYNGWREDGGASVPTGGRDVLLARVERMLQAFAIDHVTLTGGEPFAHPGILPLLDLLTRYGVPAQIISNGGVIDDDLARALSGHPIRFVQITLNGPTRALHEEHVGRGHFDRTITGIRLLRDHGVPVVGCIVMTKRNHHAIGATLALFKSLGVAHVALSRFSPAGYAARHAATLLPSRDELIHAFEQAAPFAAEGVRLSCTMPVPPCAVEVERFPMIGFGTCPIGTSMQEFALGPDGKLRHCTLHGDAIGGYEDVLDPAVDLAALFRAKDVTEYRRNVPEFCKGCLHEKTCGGGCGAAAKWMFGPGGRSPDPFVMQHVDDDFATRLERERHSGRTHLDVIL